MWIFIKPYMEAFLLSINIIYKLLYINILFHTRHYIYIPSLFYVKIHKTIYIKPYIAASLLS